MTKPLPYILFYRHAAITGYMTGIAPSTSFEKANTAYEEGQDAFRKDPSLDNSLKNYNDIKNRNKMDDAVRGARKDHGYTNPSKGYSAGDVSTGFSGGQAVMPGVFRAPEGTSDGKGPALEQTGADKKKIQPDVPKKIRPKIDTGKIAIGTGTALSALSGLTGFAAKMGDASRKLTQTALSPSPAGLSEMKGFADTAQLAGDAARTGIKGIADTQKQFRSNKKLLENHPDDFKDYRELEKIREKYVDMMDKTPDEADWGPIAEQYQNEVIRYFADAGRDISKLDPNSIQAKQMKRTARELTNMGQRKKSRVSIENAEKVLDAKEEKFHAATELGDARSSLKDLNMEPKKAIDLMLSKGVDVNGNALSAKDKDVLDLLVNDVGDIEAAGNWSVGERFDADVYAKLLKKAQDRAAKSPVGSAERQKWEKYAVEFGNQTTDDAVKRDDILAKVKNSYIEDPNKPIIQGVMTLNAGKARGYKLRNDIDIKELGFIPDKNLIKDFRDVASTKENAIRYKMDQIRQNAVSQNRALNADEDDQIKEMQKQLENIDHQRDLVTSAYMYSDVAVNIAEAIERTIGGDGRVSPHMIFSNEAEAQRLLANPLNPTGDADKWFELMKTHDMRYAPTDEQLKAAIMLKTRKVAKTVTGELRRAWENHEQLGAEYKGMGTEITVMGADGRPKTESLSEFMADEMAGILNNYDLSLSIIHRGGSKVPPNGKQIMSSIGFITEDMRDRILDRMDQQTMVMASGGFGGGAAPEIPWKFGGGMKAYGEGGKEITIPGGSFRTMTPMQLTAYQTDPQNDKKGEEVAKVSIGKWLYDVKNTRAFLEFCKSRGTTPDEKFDEIADPLKAFMTYDTARSAGGMPRKYMSRLKNFIDSIYLYEQQANGPMITDEIYDAYNMTKPPNGYDEKSAMSPAMMLALLKKVP